MEKIDNCRNCLYYKPHFAQNDDGEMYKLDTGHCEHPNMHVMPFRRCFNSYRTCQYWQIAKDESPKENINDIIKNMATRIEQIAAHLNIK